MRKRFVNIARKEAMKSSHQFKVSALLIYGNSVISTGYNKHTKRHKISYRNYSFDKEISSIHAEISALINVDKEISKKCNLYVFRFRRDNGKMALAKPCTNCMNVINDMGIKKIFYTISENEFGTIDLRQK